MYGRGRYTIVTQEAARHKVDMSNEQLCKRKYVVANPGNVGPRKRELKDKWH